jgi:NADH-quinone oxidoreductase subunit G
VRRAAALQATPLSVGPAVSMHPAQAQAAGLEDGRKVRLHHNHGTEIELIMHHDDRVPDGAVLIESGYAETAALPTGGNIRIEGVSS